MDLVTTEGDEGAANLIPLLLAFMAPAFPLPMLLLFAFSSIRDSGGGGGGGDLFGSWRRKESDARQARHDADRAQHDVVKAHRASQAPQPWPQAAPSNLPPFPGGWDFAEPPSKGIQQRAWQLLAQLWAQGQGSIAQELTDGEWITYRAEIVASGKKGVVAYRLRKGARPAAPPPEKRAQAPAVPSHDAPIPVSTAAPQYVGPNSQAATAAPPPAPMPSTAHVPATAASPARPVLRQGSGMGSLASHAPYVMDLQKRLHVVPVDGKFGADTRENVKTFQRSRGLPADGIVGDHTWAALDSLVDPASLPQAPHTPTWWVDVGPTVQVQRPA